ncbi:MAG: hypothetical protein BGO90_13075 [Legionella sp. 40-6]|nr:YcaO-like family protein [Legionella sp.]OJY40370.1 MAG: hypothetical protein BGO90_13075 [Legionella sp. 40-6]
MTKFIGHFPQLPQCKINHASLQHAHKFKLCGESFLAAPKSVVVDGLISYGGSTGIGLTLPAKAYGEFYERNHLFTQVKRKRHKKLATIAPSAYRDKLLSLCDLQKNSAHQCLEHHFAVIDVFNLFNHQRQDFFYNAISLNGHHDDRSYLSFSDSCACAAHPQQERALYNSLMEFLERQALLGSWLSKSYQYTINPEILRRITPYAELVEMLLDNGELHIFQNGNQLPGHSVIMFYFAESAVDPVQYSVGSSSGLTLEEALQSSLEELYQCYTFLYNTESSQGLANKAGAGYHLEFQQCNHKTIRDTIPFMRNIKPYLITSVADLRHAKQYSYEEILAELAQISPDIYYYHQFDANTQLHHTKILSPDFFMHMSLTHHLNLNNAYARKLHINSKNAFLGKIPFP